MVIEINKEAQVKYGFLPSKYSYNNLLMCYAKRNQPVEAENVLREMVDNGIKPDVVSYTTLIDANKRQGRIERCWEIFKDLRIMRDSDEIDEMLLSYMLRLCAYTHDSEKAMLMFTELETNGFTEHAKPYNSLISALASTKRHSEKAIEYWQQMQLKGIVPDQHTPVMVLKACSKLGDTTTAYDVLQDMKLHGLNINEHVYNGLIRTYAGAAAQREVKEEHIDLYIKDAWALFDQLKAQANVPVNGYILNSLLMMHTVCFRVEELDAKVLPLYDKYKIPYDIYTFQHLSKMYLNMADYEMVKTLYRNLKTTGVTPNQLYLNSVLEASVRTDDADIVYDALKDFLAIKREPHRRLLNTLNNLKHIPDRIYMLLRENFPHSGL